MAEGQEEEFKVCGTVFRVRGRGRWKGACVTRRPRVPARVCLGWVAPLSSSRLGLHHTTPTPYKTTQVDKVYKDLKPVGKGSYGIVCSALHCETGESVAIKRVSPISAHVIDAKHVLREIRMMRCVRWASPRRAVPWIALADAALDG